MVRLIPLTVGISSILATVVGVASAAPTAPVVNGRVAWSPTRPEIAVAVNVGGRDGIVIARPDGSRARFLTPSPDPDPRVSASFDPAWSPDGNRIAFNSAAASDSSVFVRLVGRAGSGLRTVASGQAPAWSPDGSQVAFQTFDPVADPVGLAVIDLRTGVQQPLDPSSTGAPRWQPTGRLIAFGSAGPGMSHRIVIVRADGRDRRVIAVGDAPVWSSDGRLLAYVNANSIYLVHPDGSGKRRIPGVPAGEAMAWAPGRRLLAVVRTYGPYSRRGGYVVDVVNGRVRRVLSPDAATQAFGPSWSRDGGTLAFVTRSHRIYMVDADGHNGHVVDLRLTRQG